MTLTGSKQMSGVDDDDRSPARMYGDGHTQTRTHLCVCVCVHVSVDAQRTFLSLAALSTDCYQELTKRVENTAQSTYIPPSRILYSSTQCSS